MHLEIVKHIKKIEYHLLGGFRGEGSPLLSGILSHTPHLIADTMHHFRTTNFIGSGNHTDVLFSGLGSIVLLFILLFSQPIL